MRKAWYEAIKRKDYDYFWILNDDTHIFPNCLTELLKADRYTIEQYKKQGIYIGATQDEHNKKTTYGGHKLQKWGKTNAIMLQPHNGIYQICELGNANIMFIPRIVYHKIGGFCDKYTHGIADYDYTLRATRAGIPVLLLPNYAGICNDDHKNSWNWKLPLKKRIDFLYSPKGFAYKEYLYYIHEFFPKYYYIEICKLWLRTLFPAIWNKIKTKR